MQEILLIGEDGERLGTMHYSEAKKVAKSKELDLIEVNKDKSVFKLGDRGKLKYDRKRKEKEQRAQRRIQKIKEIQLRPTIEDADLAVKIRRAHSFLEHGMKTKIIMKFKKQQLLYKDAGMQKMQEIINNIVNTGIASADSTPKFEGRGIIVFLTPNK